MIRRLWCRLFHEHWHSVVVAGHATPRLLRHQCVQCNRCWLARELIDVLQDWAAREGA